MNNDSCTTLNGEMSRNDLLSWVSTLTNQSFNRVQQLGTGSAYCQIVDILQPGKVQLAKVNVKAKTEYEFINNFKMLQQCFSKLGIYKDIEIEKLVKCKYQDNLEFLQWFYKYFEGQLARKDSLNNSSRRTSSHHRSLSRRGPSPSIAHNISKIQRRQLDNGSFQEVLDDLDKSNSNSQEELTCYYKEKIFEIHQLVDCWDLSRPSNDLRQRIEGILFRPAPEELKQGKIAQQ